MKYLVLTAAIAAVVATPAVARDHYKARHHHAYRHVVPAYNAYGYMGRRDPYSVYVNGHYAGRDPDPNVRQSLVNEYYWLHRPFY